MQSGNIAPVDIARASIGSGMAVYSRYSKVLEPNDDRLTVRTALQLINQMLDDMAASDVRSVAFGVDIQIVVYLREHGV